MNLSTVQKRLFAWGMGRATEVDMTQIKLKNCSGFESLGALKQTLLGRVKGTVVEIGPGAGASFAYYQPDINWIGIEPNIYMRSYLETAAKQQGQTAIALYQGSAENLPLDDHTADFVVSTHVLCSVQDPARSLQEIKRILKPGGELIFVEHVADDHHTLTYHLQRGINPVWQCLFDNCHLNRETGKTLVETGFKMVEYYQFQLTIPLVSPHIAGIARTV